MRSLLLFFITLFSRPLYCGNTITKLKQCWIAATQEEPQPDPNTLKVKMIATLIQQLETHKAISKETIILLKQKPLNLYEHLLNSGYRLYEKNNQLRLIRVNPAKQTIKKQSLLKTIKRFSYAHLHVKIPKNYIFFTKNPQTQPLTPQVKTI